MTTFREETDELVLAKERIAELEAKLSAVLDVVEKSNSRALQTEIRKLLKNTGQYRH